MGGRQEVIYCPVLAYGGRSTPAARNALWVPHLHMEVGNLEGISESEQDREEASGRAE